MNYIELDNAREECGCFNTGTCVGVPDGDGDFLEIFCECPIGFFGNRCHKVEVFFSADEKKEESQLAVAIVLPILAVLIIAAASYITWRKFSKAKKLRRFRQRAQTRASIEGVTIVPVIKHTPKFTIVQEKTTQEKYNVEKPKVIITRKRSEEEINKSDVQIIPSLSSPTSNGKDEINYIFQKKQKTGIENYTTIEA